MVYWYYQFTIYMEVFYMKIEKKSTSQLIVDRILEDIEKGSFKSGDKLPPERELAETLGVSRMPLREAICALSVMGVVESRQGGGNYIASYRSGALRKILQTYTFLSDSFLNEILEARLYTESIAARIAAKNATEQDLEKIRTACEQFRQAIYEMEEKHFYSFERISELDDMVHLGIAAASHNSFFIQFVDILHQTGYIQGDIAAAYEEHLEYQRISIDYHFRICQAIAEHDENAAYDLMREHISNIHETVSPKTVS